MHSIEHLFNLSDKLAYPPTMRAVRGEIAGVAFFPGGNGTFDNSTSLAGKPVMILGQDFDTEANFDAAKRNKGESLTGNATWRNLLKLLQEADISPEACFFTNAIMGVRKAGKNTGKSPGFKDPAFLQECRRFFLEQLVLQQPQLVLALGLQVAAFLAPLAPELANWEKHKSLTDIDTHDSPLKANVTFLNGVRPTVLLLTHPSYRPVNVQRRRFKELCGPKAELAMLNSAWRPNL